MLSVWVQRKASAAERGFMMLVFIRHVWGCQRLQFTDMAGLLRWVKKYCSFLMISFTLLVGGMFWVVKCKIPQRFQVETFFFCTLVCGTQLTHFNRLFLLSRLQVSVSFLLFFVGFYVLLSVYFTFSTDLCHTCVRSAHYAPRYTNLLWFSSCLPDSLCTLYIKTFWVLFFPRVGFLVLEPWLL